LKKKIKDSEEHLKRMSVGGGLSASNYLHLSRQISILRDLKFRREKLYDYSLDESNLAGTVNHERYYTQDPSFLSRMIQLRDIHRLLRTVGFERMSHQVSLSDEISDFCRGTFESCEYPGAQIEPYSRYSNRNGTYVEVLPTSSIRPKRSSGLTIDVAKKGTFEDYVWNCNLFRKYFGLKERVGEENRK